MTRFERILLAPILMVGAWLIAGPAMAQSKSAARLVQDDAGMFSAKAKDQANADIGKIKTSFKKDLAVETVARAPEPSEKVTPEAKRRFYNEWALDRFKNQQVNGVYVVLAKEPHILRIVVGDETRRQNVFTLSDEEKLTSIMLAEMKAGKPDSALTKATEFVYTTMATHKQARTEAQKSGGAAAPISKSPSSNQQPQTPTAAGGTNWVTYLIIGIAIFLGLWLLMGLFRGMSGAGGGASGMAGGGGGGGFLTSMLGGLFGAAAGMWLYNNFLGGHSTTAYGAGPSSTDPGGSGASSEPTDVGGGGSVSGGDYDGGDAGGGDAGGGDWGGGGGDWGGGGGDFGGGGGDW